MKKKISLVLAVALILLSDLAVFMLTYKLVKPDDKTAYVQSDDIFTEDGDDTAQSSQEEAFFDKLGAKLGEVDEIYRELYIGELDEDLLIDYAVDGYVVGTGDLYGRYYNEEEFEQFTADMEGEFSGIGVNVIYNTDYQVIEVLSVIPDSPAEEAGLMPGDLIVKAGEDHEDVAEIGYEMAIDKIRGEKGTYAYFTVARGEDYSELIDFEIIRDDVKEVSVMYHVFSPDPTVGVIKITEFHIPTSFQFIEAVQELVSQGCEKLVIDLRYNPGGELNSIVQTLDYIVPQGPIVHIMDGDGNEVRGYYSGPEELDIPMAVIVNGSTASAAELFTSGVRDYNKAIIVGTTTYGKGCMQTTVPLSTGGALTVTYRMYNPPFSENYHGVGIVPDVVVELDESLEGKSIYKFTDEEDNQLCAAVDALNGLYD